jgi:Lrp/AsnC family transcriptional regulator, leucine-responsive regulatory protein
VNHFQLTKSLDQVDWQILVELQQDARLPFAEIGRRVGLSSPAVVERVRRLEDAGIITGYRAEIDLERLGLPIQALLRVRFPGDRYKQLNQLAASSPEVLECHHVTGDDCFVVKVATTSMQALEEVIGRFGIYGQTTTSIIMSSPITSRVIEPYEGS